MNSTKLDFDNLLWIYEFVLVMTLIELPMNLALYLVQTVQNVVQTG